MLTGESHQVFEQKMTTAYHSYLNIGTVLKDQQGQIWFGDASLFQYDETQNKLQYFQHEPSNPNSLTDKHVASLFEDSKGRIWVGTANGLNLWKPETQHFQQIFPTDYLSSTDIDLNYIACFEEDKKGNLWIGTTAGLLYFDIKAMSFQAYTHQKGQVSSLSEGGIGNFSCYKSKSFRDDTVDFLGQVVSLLKGFKKIFSKNTK